MVLEVLLSDTEALFELLFVSMASSIAVKQGFDNDSKTIFSEKSLSVPIPSVHLSAHLSVRPVMSPNKVTETENIAEQNCQINFTDERSIFKVKVPPLHYG